MSANTTPRAAMPKRLIATAQRAVSAGSAPRASLSPSLAFAARQNW
jgi:hypothetical protein